jgi:hypothetical protein
VVVVECIEAANELSEDATRCCLVCKITLKMAAVAGET